MVRSRGRRKHPFLLMSYRDTPWQTLQLLVCPIAPGPLRFSGVPFIEPGINGISSDPSPFKKEGNL